MDEKKLQRYKSQKIIPDINTLNLAELEFFLNENVYSKKQLRPIFLNAIVLKDFIKIKLIQPKFLPGDFIQLPQLEHTSEEIRNYLISRNYKIKRYRKFNPKY